MIFRQSNEGNQKCPSIAGITVFEDLLIPFSVFSELSLFTVTIALFLQNKYSYSTKRFVFRTTKTRTKAI
uniref:7TM_GPCR_Srx domain-containing protein n=1 Tax=Caenorhabditis tropicalis TaxID=1561998 RepID=A0A1I7UY34_9PELO